MTLGGVDASEAARRRLAAELQYTGSPDDPATRDAWLHAQVMRKLADNGGTVPGDALG